MLMLMLEKKKKHQSHVKTKSESGGSSRDFTDSKTEGLKDDIFYSKLCADN